MADFAVRTFRRPDAPVHGTLFRPARPSAAVLLIGGSGGSEPSYVGEALARLGIGALSVAYFGRPGLPGQLRDIALEYFLAAQQVLREAVAPWVPLVVLGMSRGSEAAMLTAIHSGGRVGAVAAGSWPPGGAAWLLRSEALPYVTHSGPESDDPAAFIPVELVPGPVLLVGAGADRVWPSAEMARALAARLREHGDAYGHTIVEYPDAGHSLGYLIPRLQPGLLPPDLVDGPVDQAARTDASPRVVEFIRRGGGI
jgi:dienelactone hydrolase